MAITNADLIAFNNVETTDLIQGALLLPFRKETVFLPNITYANGYESLVPGTDGGIGTQVIIRKLGKGAATTVKANTDGAFDYAHGYTADIIHSVPLDDVIKQSEKVYEAVDIARISNTGARKAEIVLANTTELSQELISAGLRRVVNVSTNVTPSTALTIKDDIIDEMAKLDRRPDVLMVTPKIYTELLKLVTSGDFIPVIRFDTIKTGLLGTILGLEVYIDEDMEDTNDFVLYNHNYFYVFNVLQFFDVQAATDFNGTYVRSLMLQGTWGEELEKGDGSWGVLKNNA